MARARIAHVAAYVGVFLLTICLGLYIYGRKLPFVVDERNKQIDQSAMYKINGHAEDDFSPILRLNRQCLACIISGISPGPDNIDANIDISFPTILNVDDTVPVSLKYGVVFNKNDVPYLPKAFPASTISLMSSGLEIAPSKSITISAATKLPLTTIWTVHAKRAGKQAAILSISQDLIETNIGIIQSAFTLNGKALSSDDLRNIVLPIDVRTTWGITNLQLSVINAFIGTIAFLLTLPLLTEWAKNRLASKGGREGAG